ncbi:MAG: divergent polysaccharide deacetylase family protein, partial [Phyllobacteriaceae bacterium]|nr:divergent polysaccharide deacetylase family protein [Phyllobacteriaceae bacterium]
QPLPFAGEPLLSLSVPAPEEIQTASTDAAPAAGDEAATDVAVPDIDAQDPASEAVVDEPVGQQAVRSNDAIIVQPRRSLAPAPIDAVTEVTTWGQLPRISKGGDKPSKVYARMASLNDIHSDTPKIAILLGGLGLNAKLTQRAIKELPGEVTLAFAPYGEKLQEQVNKARAQGHEVFLQMPLEPIGYPASNPGPKTLLGDATEAENIDAMRWQMSRFTGYAGVVNYMGGRFLSMPKPLKPVFTELKNRGLLFLEDGSLALSATEQAAKAANLQAKRAKVVIDADPSPQAISNALNMLEEEARTNGLAVGTGSGLEVTIDTLIEWAKEANERGIILVPVTASYKGRLG